MRLNRFLASDLRFLQCRCQLGDPADPAMAVTRSARRVGAIGTTLGRPNVPNNAGDFGFGLEPKWLEPKSLYIIICWTSV